MIKFNITTEDLNNLGYPSDMKKEMYLNYYNWIKEDKDPLRFNCVIERSLEYVDDFCEKYSWLK